MISPPPILAAFVTPVLFYGGAAAIAAPILIHLLARRRFKRIRWAAMDFLIDAERRNRRRIRMEEWILLAMRCLAIVLLALIVSRPFLRPGGLVSAFGGSRQTERVFVLDDSYSMAYQTGDRDSFARAKLAVRKLIEVIRNEAPDDTVTILRMTDISSPVESGTYLDETQTDELLSRLEALTASNRSMELGHVIEGVANYLQRSESIINAAVYLVSDFQRHDWVAAASSGAAPQEIGLFGPLAEWAGKDRGLRIVCINVGEPDATNKAVTQLDLAAGQLVAGTTGAIRATVVNYAEETAENVALNVSVGYVPQPSNSIPSLAAGQETSVDLEVEFFRAGREAVRVDLPPDALPLDDARFIVADVARAIRVLIVNGEPSADTLNDEAAFLATALRPEGEVFSGNEYVIVDEVELEETNLADFHTVILANVYRISAPVIEALERFVRRGGGVVVFLGDQVDPELYNSTLYRSGDGLLPASLMEVVRAPDEVHLTITDRLHPTVRGVEREGDPLGIGRIPFFSYFRCEPFDAGADADRSDEAETVGSRLVRVIARFEDREDSPAIVERPLGSGRVVLVTTSADKEWNQWPDHPTYLPIINELVHHVAKASDSAGEHWVGATIELPLDPAVFEADALLRTPAFPAEREVVLTAVPAGDGDGLALKWEQTDKPGVYQFVLQRREGGEDVYPVAVNPDPRESDLTMCSPDELRRAAKDVPFEYIQGIDNLGGETGEGRTEFWRVFLIAALMVLMGEQGLAWWWGVRR